MQKHLIEIKNLSKFYSLPKQSAEPIYALKNIHLNIPQGCIYGIIGLSGAGKSTLFRCLSGLEKLSSGSIYFDGQELFLAGSSTLDQLRQQMGMIFQNFHLFSSRTVAQNISYPLEIAGLSSTKRQARIDELLQLVGLEAKKHAYPAQLSGGEKQRVGIARALAHGPRLLLCDEPTSALDTKNTQSILQLLTTLNQQLGLTILLITHQLESVKQICQRLAVLAHGEIIEEGEVKKIFKQPQHPITQHLLGLDVSQVPADLLKTSHAGKQFVRLGFEGRQAKRPVISHMLKRYAVDVNILSGGLDYLQQTVIGHLFVELTGEKEEMEQALAFLRDQHILCEVMQ